MVSVVVNIALIDCNDLPPNALLSTYNYQVDATVAANAPLTPINSLNDISTIKGLESFIIP